MLNVRIFTKNSKYMFHWLVPYSQLSLQSVDFSISFSELLFKLQMLVYSFLLSVLAVLSVACGLQHLSPGPVAGGGTFYC